MWISKNTNNLLRMLNANLYINSYVVYIFLCPNGLLNAINLIDFSALFLIHLNK